MHKEPILKVSNIKKSYNKKTVVDDLSFEIAPGEVVGILGHNGAGKTTAFYVTIGLVKPDQGSIFFQGIDITKTPIHKRAQMGMGYLAQEPSIFRALTVEENILCILETLNLSKEEEQKQLKLHLEEMNLTHLAKTKATLLSGGEKRRVEISRALVTNPSLLLLDEPFANIDPITISDVKNMIRMLKKRGISVFITDHNAREIFSIVDRCYLMANGKNLASGSSQELMESEIARESYLGAEFSL